MKLYDFDGLFDEKLKDYMAKRAGKYGESEWEDIIPALYGKFGDTPLKSIGKTPREYYAEMSGGELIKILRAHLKQGVPVSGFLREAVERGCGKKLLAPLLCGTAAERDFALEMIGADAEIAPEYLKMLVSCDDGEFRDRCAELLGECADAVADDAVNYYEKGIYPRHMLEILSKVNRKSDGVFNILLKAFRTETEDLPAYAGYLATYGDERALKYLLERIDDDGITFPEFQELKYAIESLGGEYTRERDFSDDPYYRVIYPNG